jgi:hypothetical protein
MHSLPAHIAVWANAAPFFKGPAVTVKRPFISPFTPFCLHNPLIIVNLLLFL